MNFEELLAKHKPPVEQEHEPCGTGQLYHLNVYGLLQNALDQQAELSGLDEDEPAVISKLVAWQVLADAQRNGLRLEPISLLKKGGGIVRRRATRGA